LRIIPPEEKRDWLEEANNFIGIAVSKEKLQRWERVKTLNRKSDDQANHTG